MKRIALAASIGIFLVTTAVAQNAPLGDYARQARKQKGHQAPAVKSYDNDNLPKVDKLSVVGPAVQAEAENNAAETKTESNPEAKDDSAENSATVAASKDAADKPKTEDTKAEDTKSERGKMLKDWEDKIRAQQGEIDLLSREVDVANREYRLRAAAFYADAGNRLRNAAAWDKEDSQYKDQITQKQKRLDEAKQKLEDLREQARKAGVPSSIRE